jgi:hypothetical protein
MSRAQLQSMQIQRVLLQNSPLSKKTLSVPIPTGPVDGLLFASRAQATQAFLQRQAPHNWQPLRTDVTIPQTQADRNRYVAQLKTAMVDISQCNDSTNTTSFQERWANIARGISVYAPQDMDMACENLLDVAEHLHRHGPSSLHIYDSSKLRTISQSRNLTFARRIETLCALLRLSKSRCDMVMDFDDLGVTVGAPAYVISMIKSNKKQNVNRRDLICRGRSWWEVESGGMAHQQLEHQQSIHRLPDMDVVDHPGVYADSWNEATPFTPSVTSVRDRNQKSAINSPLHSSLPTRATLLGFGAAPGSPQHTPQQTNMNQIFD